MTTVFVRHPDLRLTEVGEEGVVLHLGSRQYFSVNETGVLILNELREPKTMAELVAAMMSVYEVTTEVAEQTAREFLAQCGSAGLVHEEDR